MDGLLTEIKTVKQDGQPSLSTAPTTPPQEVGKHEVTAELSADPTSSSHILAVLRSRPDHANLAQALSVLDPSSKKSAPQDFDIRLPGPKTAQVLNVLVSTIIPDHWESFNAKDKGNSKTRAALLRCLSSVAGVSSLVAQLRSLIPAARSSSQQAKGSGSQIQIQHVLEVLSALLEPRDFISRLYADIESLYNSSAQKQVAWRELQSLIAASKVLSIAAEALTLAGDFSNKSSVAWIGDGLKYTTWLGSNICYMASKTHTENKEAWTAVAALTGRALSLGYTDQLASELYRGLLLDQDHSVQFGLLFDNLRPTEQLAVIEATFRSIEKKYLSNETFSTEKDEQTPSEIIGGIAALCSVLINKRPLVQTQLIEWLSKGEGGSISTIGLRRALVANFAEQTELMQTLLTKCLEQSSDKFYIQQASIRSQEANTQTLLLAAGYLQRTEPLMVMAVGRSSSFLSAVSNRLAASSGRARFLGMIIGTAISRFIEPAGKSMKFDLEEMESDEAHWYLHLSETADTIRSIESIRSPQATAPKSQQGPAKTAVSASQPAGKKSQKGKVKIVSIEEIGESENEAEEDEDEDEDLVPYEKPDEDASDSDDDPTLAQRNKPTAPVYIHDLITYLRDTDNVERYELALTTSPSLIRRKTGFGTELVENEEPLALTLVGLQEQSKMAKFHEYRLQSMIALIVSHPLKMARWFAAILFDGDLSQVQRSAVLTALGLSARELAGNGEEDAKTLGLPSMPDSSFPSKKLPPSLEAVYGSMSNDSSPIESLTRKLSQASIQPMAADAADNLTGPNALKVRTFSSRMDVEKRRQLREQQRQKSTIKDLYNVLADGFFYPLKGRFEIMLSQFSSSTAPSYNPFLTPHLLTLFINTLSLTLSTMGPHTPHLHALTHETLTFILSLHTRPLADDPTILSSLLSFFLAVVDLNVESGSTGEERLVTEFARQVVELREWAGMVFEKTPRVEGDEGRERVRVLAAGVMVKLGEVMERYQGRLMGVGMGFS